MWLVTADFSSQNTFSWGGSISNPYGNPYASMLMLIGFQSSRLGLWLTARLLVPESLVPVVSQATTLNLHSIGHVSTVTVC